MTGCNVVLRDQVVAIHFVLIRRAGVPIRLHHFAFAVLPLLLHNSLGLIRGGIKSQALSAYRFIRVLCHFHLGRLILLFCSAKLLLLRDHLLDVDISLFYAALFTPRKYLLQDGVQERIIGISVCFFDRQEIRRYRRSAR